MADALSKPHIAHRVYAWRVCCHRHQQGQHVRSFDHNGSWCATHDLATVLQHDLFRLTVGTISSASHDGVSGLFRGCSGYSHAFHTACPASLMMGCLLDKFYSTSKGRKPRHARQVQVTIQGKAFDTSTSPSRNYSLPISDLQ